jgi:hypothetical protein
MNRGNGVPPERIFVRFIGYIDPLEQKLVPVGGEAYGEDGEVGLKAERKRIDPRWSYALARTLGIGLDILYQRLGLPFWVLPNVGDINIILPNPIGVRGGWGGGWGGGGITPPQAQYLLRVTANQMAYVLVSELPPTIDGSQIQRVESILQPLLGAPGGPGWTPGMGMPPSGMPPGMPPRMGMPGTGTGPGMPPAGPGWVPGMPSSLSQQREYQELLQMLQQLP